MVKIKRLMMIVLCTTLSICTMTWHLQNHSISMPKPPAFQRKRPNISEINENIQKAIKEVKGHSSNSWKMHKQHYQELQTKLHKDCNGFDDAINTQNNSPLGSMIKFEMSLKRLLIKKELFSLFPKTHPFGNKIHNTCTVVGNGGILAGSNCGKMIDSADFVFRCNLPPLKEEFATDVGQKTNLVTVNPSILFATYKSLLGRRRPFAEKLQDYGNAMVLIPAFSYESSLEISYRALYTLEDFDIPAHVVFFNPVYLTKLGKFWRVRDLNAPRLSSGFMIISLALEVCSKVDVYGFWPYGNHPTELYSLFQHYYDDAPTNAKVHSMPQEFKHLLRLHNTGVLNLHLHNCKG